MATRTASTPAGGSKTNQHIKPGTTILLSVLGVLVGSVAVLFALPDSSSLFKSAPLQVLLGSAIFLCLIALIVLVFARLGLYDRASPLALPEGSVRALLALILLIIFIIFANLVFGQLASSTTSEQVAFSGLTQTQIGKLQGIVETVRTAAGSTTTAPLYDGVYRVSKPSADASNLGQQVVTGLLTLVAAISAFYFGTGSVAAGAKAVQSSRSNSGSPGLKVLRPNQPLILSPLDGGGYAEVQIQLGGDELDEAGVQAARPGNDEGGQLVPGNSQDTYVYQPSGSATNPVTLHFVSTRDSRIAVDLVVSVPADKAAADKAAADKAAADKAAADKAAADKAAADKAAADKAAADDQV